MRRIGFAYLVVLVAVLTRFIPHLPNFSPVLASLLFGGAYLKRRDAVWYPLVLLAASDFALTTLVYRMNIGVNQCLIWLGFAVVAMIGYSLRTRQNVGAITFAALARPTAFFVISNFGVWLGGHGARMYPATWDGFGGLPYGRSSVLPQFIVSHCCIHRRAIRRERNLREAAPWDHCHSSRRVAILLLPHLVSGDCSKMQWRASLLTAFSYPAV